MSHTIRVRIVVLSCLVSAMGFAAVAPTQLSITPPGRTDTSQTTVSVTVKGGPTTFCGSTPCPNPPSPMPTFAFLDANKNPTKMITATNITVVDDKTVTATFNLKHNAWGVVGVTVSRSADGTVIASGSFDTGVYCLEALEATGCTLRWEVDTSAVTGTTSQTSNNTAPNILFKLDFQWAKNKDTQTGVLNANRHDALRAALTSKVPDVKALDAKNFDFTGEINKLSDCKASNSKAGDPCRRTLPDKPGATSFADRFTTHMMFKTGYTQVTAATNLQPTPPAGSSPAASFRPNTTAASGSAGSPTPACTGSATSSGSTPCKAATPQQAFVADASATFGWVFGRNGQGTFAEAGFGGRAAFQDLLQSNQVVTSGGVSYVDLNSLNPRNVVGLYEAVGRFRLVQPGHDTPATTPAAPMDPTKASSKESTSAAYNHNPSDLLVFEFGYQNNTGLMHLATDPAVNTRNRFVGRFYAYPELPGTNHTKIMVGMEYSGGIDGGPKVVQVFFGGNLNLPKLFSGSRPSANSSGQ